MAFMAFEGCTPAPSTEIALSPEISSISQAATTTLLALTASGGDVRVSGMSTERPQIFCRWDEGVEVAYSFMTRAEADATLAERAAEEIDVILDGKAIRLQGL